METGVGPSIYDAEYYAGRYSGMDFSNAVTSKDFHHIYRLDGSLLPPEKKDKVIDFGCGVGYMSFYSYLK